MSQTNGYAKHNGRPPLYDTPDKLQRRINQYFKKERRRPSICELALWCGFESRQSFYDYAERPGFSYVIKRANMRIAAAHEKRMFGDRCVGSIFALKNLAGWVDRSELTGSGGEPFKLIIESAPAEPVNRLVAHA